LPSVEIEVDVVDFIEVLRTHGVPHYLKIDIEGCDRVCLEALRRFQERPDYLSFESETSTFADNEEEIELLTGLGYSAFQLVDQFKIKEQKVRREREQEGSFVEHRFQMDATGLFGAELPGRWMTKPEILRHLRRTRQGCEVIGRDGYALRWRFLGAPLARFALRAWFGLLTNGGPTDWHDTHARLGKG
jgi:hypothetical protein